MRCATRAPAPTPRCTASSGAAGAELAALRISRSARWSGRDPAPADMAEATNTPAGRHFRSHGHPPEGWGSRRVPRRPLRKRCRSLRTRPADARSASRRHPVKPTLSQRRGLLERNDAPSNLHRRRRLRPGSVVRPRADARGRLVAMDTLAQAISLVQQAHRGFSTAAGKASWWTNGGVQEAIRRARPDIAGEHVRSGPHEWGEGKKLVDHFWAEPPHRLRLERHHPEPRRLPGLVVVNGTQWWTYDADSGAESNFGDPSLLGVPRLGSGPARSCGGAGEPASRMGRRRRRGRPPCGASPGSRAQDLESGPPPRFAGHGLRRPL